MDRYIEWVSLPTGQLNLRYNGVLVSTVTVDLWFMEFNNFKLGNFVTWKNIPVSFLRRYNNEKLGMEIIKNEMNIKY